MQISKRLEAVADMVTSGCRIVDVGTDHGYIPIFLTEAGKITHAIAGDVNRGPLQKAVEHISQYGLEEQIETRLSDGLAAVQPGEADSIIIAGMGGPLTVRILKEGKAVADQCRELILQPQSDIRQVRSYLEEIGWHIVREEMIFEDGKFYPMMRAVKRSESLCKDCAEATDSGKGFEGVTQEAEISASESRMSEAELRYGPLLIQKKHPVLREYLLREQGLNQKILEALKGQEGEGSQKRREEVEGELRIIGEVLMNYQED